MFYKAAGPGVYDGGAHVTLNPDGRIDYDLSVRVGTMASVKVLGRKYEKFIGHRVSYQGIVNVPVEMLSEAWLQQNVSANVGKVTFTKMDQSRWTFDGGPVSGSIYLAFDGIDPVQVERVEIPAMNIFLTLST